MVFAITSARAGHIHFEKTKTFDQISRQAELEEKGFFVYFSARWCAPCQMMNTSTFQDENLAEYISEHFIPVKMDIDEMYGKLWQDQFNVQAIPTIIFFDQWGSEVQRITSGITGSKLLELLTSIDGETVRPTLTSSFFEEPVQTKISANYAVIETTPMMNIPHMSNQYEIEVGNFFTESDVNTRIDKLTSHFEKHRFYILQRKIPAGTIYQLILGGFKSRHSADDAEQILIEEDYDPNVVRL